MATEREEDLINKLCDAHDEIDKLKEKMADIVEREGHAHLTMKRQSEMIARLSKLDRSKTQKLLEKDNQIAQERYLHEQTKSHLQVAKKQHLDMIAEREMHDR